LDFTDNEPSPLKNVCSLQLCSVKTEQKTEFDKLLNTIGTIVQTPCILWNIVEQCV